MPLRAVERSCEVVQMVPLSMPDEKFGTDVLVLRDFQDEGVKALKAGFAAGDMKQMVCGPTGSGKTELATGVLSLCYDRGSRVSFVADRIVLVDQASQRFWRYGIPHGVIQGKNTRYPDEIIQVCRALWSERASCAGFRWTGYLRELLWRLPDHAAARRRRPDGRRDIRPEHRRAGHPTHHKNLPQRRSRRRRHHQWPTARGGNTRGSKTRPAR